MSALERLAIAVLVLVAVVIGSTLGVRWYGAEQYAAGHAKAVEEQQAASLVATVARVRENGDQLATQGKINLTITENKNAEIAPVAARIAADRVRVGAGTCGGTSAGAANPASTGGGNEANPPGRLVRDDVERDTRALDLAVEEDLATGRACQAFVQLNGMAPPQSPLDSPSQTISAASSDAENVTPEK